MQRLPVDMTSKVDDSKSALLYSLIRGQYRIKPLTFMSSTCKLLDDDFK